MTERKQKYVYEINPLTKTIEKITLTKELKLKLGKLSCFQIKGTYMNLCFDKSSDFVEEWTLKMKNGKCGYAGDPLESKFKGICYLAGKTYKVEGSQWKVLPFPTFYDMYIIDDKYKEWIFFN